MPDRFCRCGRLPREYCEAGKPKRLEGTKFYSFIYGGAGVILSRGLVRQMNATQWASCARRRGGGDRRILNCVRDLQQV